jgi:hypothetical protein
MLIDILILLCVLLVAAIAVTFIAHLWIPVPFIPTPQRVVPRMVAMAQEGDIVYDLGAGDARTLIAAVRSRPGIKAIGIEFVPTVWLLGQFRILLSRQPVQLRLGNILHANLRDADCIFLYLIPSLMQKLEKKFDQEVKPGTRVITYAFSFPDRTPECEEDVPWLTGTRKLRLYVW